MKKTNYASEGKILLIYLHLSPAKSWHSPYLPRYSLGFVWGFFWLDKLVSVLIALFVDDESKDMTLFLLKCWHAKKFIPLEKKI